MKKILAAATLVALLGGCTTAQQMAWNGEVYFRVFEVMPDNQGTLLRRCTKMTQAGLCVGEPVLVPADTIPNPTEDQVVHLDNPAQDGFHTLQLDNGQKKTVRKMKGTFIPTN